MQQIYPKLKEADVIIIGTPTYYWNVSGLVKTFIDRCLPLYHKRLLKNKMAASVAVSEVDGQNLALATISSFFRLNEMIEIGGFSIARGKSEVGDRELESARVFGRMIARRALG
jgi:multimeric flavodoxin WrbA